MSDKKSVEIRIGRVLDKAKELIHDDSINGNEIVAIMAVLTMSLADMNDGNTSDVLKDVGLQIDMLSELIQDDENEEDGRNL